MKILRIRAFLLAVITVFACLTQTALPVSAAEADTLPSGVPVSELSDSADALIEEQKNGFAACSVTVFNSSDILFSKSYGYTDTENAVRNDENAVFEWGSCTKLLTWTCLMQLSEQGKINLKDDIRAYLPKDFFRKLHFDAPITFENLMNHNAGWQEMPTDLFVANPSDAKNLEETLRDNEPDQVFSPGTTVAYSNWGVGLAGWIVERVSGMTYADYVKKNIFDPLGMKHTAVRPDLLDNPWVLEKRLQEKAYGSDMTPLGTCFYELPLASAGMATGTMADFVTFARVFLVGDDEPCPLFAKNGTLSSMLSPTLFFADGKTPRNMHGFWTDILAVPVIWHNGGTMGFSSWFAFDPVSKTAMIALVNQANETRLLHGFVRLIFGTPDFTAGVPATDPSGSYISARSVFVGIAKFTHFFSYMNLTGSGSGEYMEPDGGLAFSGNADGYYLVNKDSDKSFPAFVTTDGNGRNVIQIASSDYLWQNPITPYFEYALLILFAVAALVSLVALPVIGLRHRKCKTGFGGIGKLRVAVYTGVLAEAGIVACIAGRILGGAARMADLRILSLLLLVLSVLPVIYGICLIIRRKKYQNIGKFSKMGLRFACIISILMSIDLFYWELIRFF